MFPCVADVELRSKVASPPRRAAARTFSPPLLSAILDPISPVQHTPSTLRLLS